MQDNGSPRRSRCGMTAFLLSTSTIAGLGETAPETLDSVSL